MLISPLATLIGILTVRSAPAAHRSSPNAYLAGLAVVFTTAKDDVPEAEEHGKPSRECYFDTYAITVSDCTTEAWENLCPEYYNFMELMGHTP